MKYMLNYSMEKKINVCKLMLLQELLNKFKSAENRATVPYKRIPVSKSGMEELEKHHSESVIIVIPTGEF